MAKLEPPYETYVDQIIGYKEKVLTALSQSQEIMALLADNPEIDLESEEAEKVIEKCSWDYQYVDETTQSAGAYIMVEAAKTGDNGGTLQEFALYVEIVASTEFVPLNHKKFLGICLQKENFCFMCCHNEYEEYSQEREDCFNQCVEIDNTINEEDINSMLSQSEKKNIHIINKFYN